LNAARSSSRAWSNGLGGDNDGQHEEHRGSQQIVVQHQGVGRAGRHERRHAGDGDHESGRGSNLHEHPKPAKAQFANGAQI
jgi:hypothetical protein